MVKIKSFKNEGEIRLIKTQEEWNQFIKMTQINFPEFKNILKNENLEYHKQNNRFLYGYFYNSRIIGSVGIQIVKQQKLGLLGYLQVLEEFRGKKISKILFNHIKMKLMNNDCYFIYLWVHKSNKNAIGVYKKWISSLNFQLN